MDVDGKGMEKSKIIDWGELAPTVVHANDIAVRPGQRWGWRTIPDIEFILVSGGALAYEADGVKLQAIPGDVLYIPPSERHVVGNASAVAGGSISCIHCEPWRVPYAEGAYRLSPVPARVTGTRGDPRVHELFRACAETMNGLDPYRHRLLSLACHELLIRLSSYWRGVGDRVACSERVRRCVDYVRSRILEPMSRATLAGVAGVTPEYLNDLFRRELGMTPTQLITREKMRVAARLLRDDGMSVKETAHHLGYDDQFYFSRVYKRVMGTAPSGLQR